MSLLTQNGKLKKTSIKNGLRIFNWGIPAYRSESGFATCPMAGSCAKGCYAQAGAYIWGNVRPAFERRLALSQTQAFVGEMCNEIKRVRADVVRIHDSGDFYSADYAIKWLDICRANPTVRFYAYTKMVPLFKRFIKNGRLPSNLTIIYSYGGLADHLIDPQSDRHSAVFPDRESLEQAGYAYANDDDLVAIGDNPKIGLVYHGAKSKEWKAGAA